MSTFTLTYRSAVFPDGLVLEFDDTKVDRAEVMNAVRDRQFPGVKRERWVDSTQEQTRRAG